MNLAGKTALVTGGGSGIGLGIAVGLAKAGARVVIAGRRESLLNEAVKANPTDPPLLCHAVDVTDRASVAQLVRWSTEQLGRIDILVNSAGVNIKTRSMAEMQPEQWDQVIAINATGAYNCMYAVLPQMKARQDGLIINISSVSGKRASPPGGVAYCASKFAMAALGTVVGNEVGDEGIRVTNIYPGDVDTPILANRPVAVTDEHRARILQPADFANLAVAICALPARAHVPELIVKPTWQKYQ